MLLETQAFSRRRVVVRIEHRGDGLGFVAQAHSLAVLLFVKEREIKPLAVGRLRLPQAQGVDHTAAVADHRHIVGDGAHRLTGKGHEDALVIAPHAPRVAEAQPIVGRLHLKAVFKVLPEQSVAVTDAVAVERDAHRGGRIEKARGQPAKPAVAERVVLDLFKNSGINAALQQIAVAFIEQAEVK